MDAIRRFRRAQPYQKLDNIVEKVKSGGNEMYFLRMVCRFKCVLLVISLICKCLIFTDAPRWTDAPVAPPRKSLRFAKAFGVTGSLNRPLKLILTIPG